MLEGKILLDDVRLRWLAPGEAQHFGEVVEGDCAPEVILEIDEVGGGAGELSSVGR